MRPPPTCPNCGVVAADRFCPRCGQRQGARLASVRRMVRDVAEDQLAINATLPRTIVGLLVRPGFLTREYVAGRMARYVSPFRLYLATSLLFFIVLPLVADFDRLWAVVEPQVQAVARGESTDPAPGRSRTPAGRAAEGTTGSAATGPPVKIVDTRIDPQAFPRWLRPMAAYFVAQEAKINAMPPREGMRVLYGETIENVPRVIFLLLPLFAFFLKLLYWKRLYAEHVVFALHFQAFLFALATVALAAQSMRLLLVLGPCVLIYLLLALKRAYAQSWLVTVIKYAVLLVAYYFAFTFAILFVVFLTILTA